MISTYFRKPLLAIRIWKRQSRSRIYPFLLSVLYSASTSIVNPNQFCLWLGNSCSISPRVSLFCFMSRILCNLSRHDDSYRHISTLSWRRWSPAHIAYPGEPSTTKGKGNLDWPQVHYPTRERRFKRSGAKICWVRDIELRETWKFQVAAKPFTYCPEI